MTASVIMRVSGLASSIRIAVSASASMASPTYTDPISVVGQHARHVFTGLSAGRYYYQAEVRGRLRGPVGSFTIADSSAESMRYWTASCARSNSNHPIFEAIRNQSPDFGIHTGDLFYADIGTNNISLFAAQYDAVFRRSNQAALYRSCPTYYMYDDHDYGPNDSDATSPSREASIKNFRQRIPFAHLLVASGETDATYYKFERGRVVFLVPDMRSERTPNSATDDASKVIFGTTQKAWLFNELGSNPGKLICMISTLPWVGTSTENWGAYSTARTELANAIKDAGIAGRFFMNAGDMHAVAMDDGTNTDYATGGGAAFPLLQAAPLDQTNSVKGGPWTVGPFSSHENQVGFVEIDDDGSSEIDVRFIGYRYDASATGELTELGRYEWTASV